MAFSTSSASSTPARVVYLSAQGNHVNTTGEIAMKLGDPGNEVLIIDASHSATLTNYMFQFNLPKDAAKHSFNQLLADLIESDGCVEKLTLSDYVLPVPNYPTTYIIPSLGDFSLYLSGLYGIMNKPQRYPRAVPFQKQLLTSLDTLLNKFASRFHVYIDTSPTLDIVTQMVIVAARHVVIAHDDKTVMDQTRKWLIPNPELTPVMKQHEFASICQELNIPLPVPEESRR